MLFRSIQFFFGGLLLSISTIPYAKPGLVSIGSSTTINKPTQKVEKPAGELSINLQNAINKAFEHNPDLHTFNYALSAQQGRVLQASMASSPELSLVIEDVLGTKDLKGFDSAQATLGIAWVLEGNIRKAHTAVAHAGSSSLSTEAAAMRLHVAAETARLYIINLANQARLANAINTVALAEETTSAVRRRVKAGKAPAAELARAEAELIRRQLEEEDIQHERRKAIHLLAAQWGETEPSFTHVEGSIFNLPNIPTNATLKAQVELSPDFSRLAAEQDLLQARLNLAESQGKAVWRVNLGIRHFVSTNDQALVAGFNLPIGKRSKNTGNIAAARESLAQTYAQQSALKVRFETMLFVLFEELQHSVHYVIAYRDQIIPQLEKALEGTRRAYKLGRYSYLEWRSVQVDLLGAHSALVEASVDAHLKIIEIERLTGASMQTLATQPDGKY